MSELKLMPFRLTSAEEFTPHSDQVLVKVIPEQTEYAGLIAIPQRAQRPGAVAGSKYLRKGTVVRVGPGERKADDKRGPMGVAVGDLIIYDHPSNREVTIGGELYVILHEEQHVLVVCE